MPDEAAARAIRADEIDILIDLNGLTTGTRMAILRWRPAPIQATYLGFIGPVPMPELDFLLCDEFVIPPALRRAVSAAAAVHRAELPGQRQQAGDRRAGHARQRRPAGRSFRVLLLLQPLQNHRADVRAPGWRSCAASKARCCGWSPTTPGRATICARARRGRASIRSACCSPAGSVPPTTWRGSRCPICSWTPRPITPAPSPATRSAWGCRWSRSAANRSPRAWPGGCCRRSARHPGSPRRSNSYVETAVALATQPDLLAQLPRLVHRDQLGRHDRRHRRRSPTITSNH